MHATTLSSRFCEPPSLVTHIEEVFLLIVENLERLVLREQFCDRTTVKRLGHAKWYR